MERLFALLAEAKLPAEKRELALNSLCRKESARLQCALAGEEEREFAIPKGLPPLLFFMVDDRELAEEQREERCDALRNLCPRIALVAGEDGIVFCCHCDEEERARLLCACASLLEQWGCRGAVSQSVSGGTFGKYLRLVRLTYEVSKQVGWEHPLARFEDHASMVLFSLLQAKMPLPLYHAEEALQVISQDYENNTDLSGSLYGYLSCFMDLKQAAERMGVHRNTIAYHIRKILSLLGTERLEGELGFEILCTYRMLSMMEP